MATCPKLGISVVPILTLNPADAEAPALSLTWMVNMNVPASVGVPEIVPFEEDNVRPLGSWPPITNQVYGEPPPVACRLALKEVWTWPLGKLVVVICGG